MFHVYERKKENIDRYWIFISPAIQIVLVSKFNMIICFYDLTEKTRRSKGWSF